MLKLKLQYFGHLMRIANTLEKTMMLGKIKGRRRKSKRNRRRKGGREGEGEGEGERQRKCLILSEHRSNQWIL